MEKMETMLVATLTGMVCVAAGASTPAVAQDANEGSCAELKPQPFSGRPIRSGQEAPNFEATDISGKSWSLRALRGRPVLINFWATWCEPCRKELPALEGLARRTKGRVTVLTVNVDENEEAAKSFFPKGTNLPVLLDNQRQAAKRFGAEKFPETFLLDSRGQLQHLFFQADWSGPAAEACLAGLR